MLYIKKLNYRYYLFFGMICCDFLITVIIFKWHYHVFVLDLLSSRSHFISSLSQVCLRLVSLEKKLKSAKFWWDSKPEVSYCNSIFVSYELIKFKYFSHSYELLVNLSNRDLFNNFCSDTTKPINKDN